MKKNYLILAILLCGTLSGFSQKFTNFVSLDASFKRHYSWSIEGGFVDNQPRQFIAGNQSDFILSSDGAQDIRGRSINGTTFLTGTNEYLNPGKYLLTDFTIVPGSFEYAAGTGIYFPTGGTGMGYPFLGIFQRRTMTLISLQYYNVAYPVQTEDRNAAGVRIKYSPRAEAYYISGCMVDDAIVDLNFNDIRGKSKGFIMKIKAADLTSAQLRIIEPDQFQNNPEIPSICSVNDMEISSDESYIIYTGVNTEQDFSGYTQPMVGKIDMDLNPIWGNTYEIQKTRYSGIDVEFGNHESSIFVLMNSETTPMSIMELDPNGIVLQQPVQYDFSTPSGTAPNLGAARGHIMHYTPAGGLIVTGNCFTREGVIDYQELFKYEVTNATNLLGGNLNYEVFAKEIVPLGNQFAVTSWWAPENSIYRDNNLSIIGEYFYPDDHGIIYINENGFDKTDPDCFYEGNVKQFQLSTHPLPLSYSTDLVEASDFTTIESGWSPPALQSCPVNQGKSGFIDEINDQIKLNWQYRGNDNSGMHLVFNTSDETNYHIKVYDITGRLVHSESINVSGEKFVYLKFNTTNQLYLINVQNNQQSETIKVTGVK